jgi:hypothetical protein
MPRLIVLRGMAYIFARLVVRPGTGGHPTDRTQDKNREVRCGRVAEERRNIRRPARGATAHDSLPIRTAIWECVITCTSRAPAS